MPTRPHPETGARTETLTGHVVDIACIRKYPRDELLDRARRHPRVCALMGHCIESGYGLVDDTGRVALLDHEATHRIVEVLPVGAERGARLRVERRERGGEMMTVSVEVAR